MFLRRASQWFGLNIFVITQFITLIIILISISTSKQSFFVSFAFSFYFVDRHHRVSLIGQTLECRERIVQESLEGVLVIHRLFDLPVSSWERGHGRHFLEYVSIDTAHRIRKHLYFPIQSIDPFDR